MGRFMKDLDAHVGQMRFEDVARKLSYERFDHRDLDAAHTLIELANNVFHLPPMNEVPSFGGKHTVAHPSAGELLMTLLAVESQQHVTGNRDGKMKKTTSEIATPLMKSRTAARKRRIRKFKFIPSFCQPKRHYNHNVTNQEEIDYPQKMNGTLNIHDSASGSCRKGLQNNGASPVQGHGFDREKWKNKATRKSRKANTNIGHLHRQDKHHQKDIEELTLLRGRKGMSNFRTPLVDGRGDFDVQYLENGAEKKSQKACKNMGRLHGRDEYDYLFIDSQKLIQKPAYIKKVLHSERANVKAGIVVAEVTDDSFLSEKMATNHALGAAKSAKKRPTFVIPTIHIGVSFSIIHLLSAVRMALISPYVEDYALVSKNRRQSQENSIKSGDLENMVEFQSCGSNIMNAEGTEQRKLPSLTITEIMQCVGSKPFDPRILQAKEPLKDLVRGVLKIFSSTTAPPGAKKWKALAAYENSTKSWSWVGPVLLPPDEHLEEDVSSEVWGLPCKTLLKLVDCFAAWLKENEHALQKIGSLPPPPPQMLMQPADSMERFKDGKVNRRASTISPSCEEVRAYFRREESVRYLIPDRAFSYTALDCRKSIVAPLRRCSGKPSAKPRDHFMLKENRPPQVTVLCLVRDAAARLPGGIGTRPDICTLIRDSQFIVEDISDQQVNQVVSGALDRLHYESDPCVRYDRDRHLWVYLHGEREEEDFEYVGTSSESAPRS